MEVVWPGAHVVVGQQTGQLAGVAGRVPASDWCWLPQLPPSLPPVGPGSASSVCDGSFETKS